VLALAASLLVTRAVLESAALRRNDRRRERLRGGRSNRRREPSALSKAGWSTILADPTPGRRYLRRFAGRAENWKFASHQHTGRAVRSCVHGAGSCASTHVDGRRSASVNYLRGGEAGSRSSRVSGHPTTKGSRLQGRCRIPFAPFPVGALLPLERQPCRSSREAPSGLLFAPPGLRGTCGAGERRAPLAGREGEHAPILLNRVGAFMSQPRLCCSDGGHPGGQGSGERCECRPH
jgi:hypothetical protein